MNRRFAFEGLDLFDSLERKLSMSCLWGGTHHHGGAGLRRRCPASGTRARPGAVAAAPSSDRAPAASSVGAGRSRLTWSREARSGAGALRW